MKQLTITQAKPNPIGKDRSRKLVLPPNQHAGEWIDIKNTSGEDLFLYPKLFVLHQAYPPLGIKAEWKKVYEFAKGDLGGENKLPSGCVVRLHSGKPIPLSSLKPEDLKGADYHVFTGQDYVWNNNRPDKPCIYDEVHKVTIDITEYKIPVIEGKILRRVQGQLI